MTFWSTVPGFASFRHEIEGEFCELFSWSLLGQGWDDDDDDNDNDSREKER
jgi:hypothetical protein